MTKYNEAFYKGIKAGSYRSASEMLPYVLQIVKPKKIVDFGCGIGTWLAVAKYLDSEIEIKGFDGDYVNKQQLLIDESDFQPADLSLPIEVKDNITFDMAISMEVAEHINEKSARTFVGNICKHAPVILFSAAPPIKVDWIISTNSH